MVEVVTKHLHVNYFKCAILNAPLMSNFDKNIVLTETNISKTQKQ